MCWYLERAGPPLEGQNGIQKESCAVEISRDCEEQMIKYYLGETTGTP